MLGAGSTVRQVLLVEVAVAQVGVQVVAVGDVLGRLVGDRGDVRVHSAVQVDAEHVARLDVVGMSVDGYGDGPLHVVRYEYLVVAVGDRLRLVVRVVGIVVLVGRGDVEIGVALQADEHELEVAALGEVIVAVVVRLDLALYGRHEPVHMVRCLQCQVSAHRERQYANECR